MEIVTLAERPELEAGMWDLSAEWPDFMLWDLLSGLYYGRIDRWANHVMLAVDGADVIARAHTVPFAFGEQVGRPTLPPDGWQAMIWWSFWDDMEDRETTDMAALEVTIRADHRGTGLGARMLEVLRDHADHYGFSELVIPVRPSGKHLEPHTPMTEYVTRVRHDGLPADPWLRIHVRAGGEIEAVCPTAMTITGTLQEWRAWTGLAFDTSGTLEVPGALVPVHVDVANDHAVYVEPNVWVRHRWAEPAG